MRSIRKWPTAGVLRLRFQKTSPTSVASDRLQGSAVQTDTSLGIQMTAFHAFIPDVSIAEKLLRTFVVYAFLIIGLRLAGKRELSQLNPFDLVVLLLLSNTVQNAIIGN